MYCANKLKTSLLTVWVLTLTSCASGLTHSADPSKSDNNATDLSLPLAGEQMCLPSNRTSIMSKELIGPFQSFFMHKHIGSAMTTAQIECDLGRPYEDTVTKVATSKQQMPMEPGDRFVRWGDHHTNDPIDEFSIMIVAGSDGIVSAITVFNTKEKTIKRIVKTETNTNVTTGTYSANRTVVNK